ncbi:hypothetical protein CR513_10347, partial [Mucuna pruriens]
MNFRVHDNMENPFGEKLFLVVMEIGDDEKENKKFGNWILALGDTNIGNYNDGESKVEILEIDQDISIQSN